MPRILPSQAVAAIEAKYPFTTAVTASSPALGMPDLGNLAGLLEVISAVPSELLVLDGADLVTFLSARGEIASAVARWQLQGKTGGLLGGVNLIEIRSMLSKCPDQAIPATVTTLGFIVDVPLREALRLDISEVENSLHENEWKSATVVAGSVIESLLLWALDQQRQAAQEAGAALPSNSTRAALRNGHFTNM